MSSSHRTPNPLRGAALVVPALCSVLAACTATVPDPGPIVTTDLRAPRVHVDRDLPVDVDHYALDLVIDPVMRSLRGTTRLRFHAAREGVRSIELDLVGLDVTGVRGADGRSLSFDYDGARIRIDLGETLDPRVPAEIEVGTSGRPAKGLWFAGGEPATHMWTQGECEDARWWFPCVDHPSDRATTEIRVTMPIAWTSVAAGTRWSSEVDGEQRTDHWVMRDPHPTYLTTLVAGELVTEAADWNGTPLQYLAPPAYSDLIPSLAPTPETLSFLSELTGRRYPFAKYATACVEAFPFGGMENVSATTITVHALDDPRGCLDGHGPEGLIAHEAAHQWFGDLVTCAEWTEIWLNEGFATYLTQMYVEHAHGEDAFRTGMRAIQERAVAGERASSRPMVHDTYVDPIDLFFSGHAYQGGAARLHLLRGVLGDATFRAGVREYLGANENRAVRTTDLQAAFERVSGKDLGVLFEEWFHRPGVPAFEVRWRHDANRERLLVTINQVQATEGGVPAVFHVPVDIEVRTEAGSTVHRLELTQRRQQFEIPCARRPRWARFDPGGWMLGPRTVQAPVAAWLALAEEGDVDGRRDALAALPPELPGADDELRGRILARLEAALEGDPAAIVRADAATHLAGLGRIGARDGLVRAARVETDPVALGAILRGLERFSADPALFALAQELFARGDLPRSAAGQTLVLAARALPAATEAWLQQLGDRLPGDSLHGDIGAGAARAWAAVGNVVAARTLVRWATTEGTPSVQREGAIRALAGAPVGSEEVREALVGLLGHRDPRLRLAAVRSLASNPTAPVQRALAAHYERSHSPREQRTIEAVLRDPDAAD